MAEVKEIYAWLADDPTQGGEHIMGVRTEAGWMQLASVDRPLMEKHAPMMRAAARQEGIRIRLAKCIVADTLMTFSGAKARGSE